jgi:hypothetical protein
VTRFAQNGFFGWFVTVFAKIPIDPFRLSVNPTVTQVLDCEILASILKTALEPVV